MKVYVMSKDALGTLRQFFNTHHQGAAYERMRLAMTPIDIPDGCQLAVVENGPKPDFSVVKGANGVLHASGIALGQEAMWDNNYRRVVQVVEVK